MSQSDDSNKATPANDANASDASAGKPQDTIQPLSDTKPEKDVKPGHAEGGTKDFPSTSPETPHAQRDGYVWNDETGWNPPQS